MSSKIEEVVPARYPGGTLRRITEVLDRGEPRSEFLREATEREIKRRRLRNARNKNRRITIYERRKA